MATEYILAVEPGCMSAFAVVADSLKEARQMLWAEMPDSVKNGCESIECVEEGPAHLEAQKGVMGNPFQHIWEREVAA